VLSPPQNIEARGVDAAGVGWLLRGFYKDHAREMDGAELAELESVLSWRSEAIASWVTRAAPAPPAIAALPAWGLLQQYYRYWSGDGHEKGGEYV
jgi:hypothetical protein